MNDHQLPGAQILKLGKYQHYKGNEYEVVGVGTHTETGEELVVYRALYGDGRLWIRPLSMFLETVIVEGVEKPRFTYLGGEQ
jgi:hypothetical protein